MNKNVNSLLVSKRNDIIFSIDLWARSLIDLDPLNLKPSKSTAFPNQNAQTAKELAFSMFDLAVKRSRSPQGDYLNNFGSTNFENISSFKAIAPLVSEKKIFKRFYHIWAWGSCSS
ncbi:MAG: hypothetical protein AB2794_18575 [Candidatus Thiodiazotropha endolucinida]